MRYWSGLYMQKKFKPINQRRIGDDDTTINVGKYMPSELYYCITLREVHIYIGQPPEKPRPMGLHTKVSRLTARGDIGGTLNSLKHHPNGPLMGRAKPHAGDGLKAQVPTT
jgi:hypothetical protein